MLKEFRCLSERVTDMTSHRRHWHYTPSLYLLGNDLIAGQRKMTQMAEITKPSSTLCVCRIIRRHRQLQPDALVSHQRF